MAGPYMVDMALGTGDNDGSTWANAKQDNAGLEAILTAANHAAGDQIFIKNNSATTTTTINTDAIATVAALTNPLQLYGVKSATTNVPPVNADLVPGNRTGNATRAYDQTSGNAAPQITVTSSADFSLDGCVYGYGLVIDSSDDIQLSASSNVLSTQIWEECSFTVSGSGDQIIFGVSSNLQKSRYLACRLCKFVTTNTGGIFVLRGALMVRYENCDFELANTGGAIELNNFAGIAIFDSCDFSGSATPIVDIAGCQGGRIEFHNCKMPASHVLTTGTALGAFTVINYGSDDQTGLGTGESEQIFELETNIGRVDVSEGEVRTGGATDGADGTFSYAALADNVTDNYVGVEVPLANIYVAGAGTEKTLEVYIASDRASSNPMQDDEVRLRLTYASEAGVSMYDYLPDDRAPIGGTLNYDAQSANFTAEAILTGGTSTATAIITSDADAGSTGTLTLRGVNGVFQTNETITDDNGSPGSATSDGTLTVTQNIGGTQLLGTVADLLTDGSTWTTANNSQKLVAKISPNYSGVIRATVIYSRTGSDTLFVEAKGVIT